MLSQHLPGSFPTRSQFQTGRDCPTDVSFLSVKTNVSDTEDLTGPAGCAALISDFLIRRSVAPQPSQCHRTRLRPGARSGRARAATGSSNTGSSSCIGGDGPWRAGAGGGEASEQRWWLADENEQRSDARGESRCYKQRGRSERCCAAATMDNMQRATDDTQEERGCNAHASCLMQDASCGM